jgi:molybdopterin synthase catalytic subunit
MVQLVTGTISVDEALRSVADLRAGAVVLFLGTARQFTGLRATESLHYECYAEMARPKLAELEVDARQKWHLCGCTIVHRLGRVELGEASVAVAVSSPHRQDAFQAGKWLIDRIKEVVPIWKMETWADGTQEWVHPGMNDTHQ